MGTQKAAHYQAVNTWVQLGSAHMPPVLQNAVRVLLMIMALANTQASIAPITLTLLFS